MVFSFRAPSLAAEKQDPGLKFSSENENFKLRMKISSAKMKISCGGGMFLFFYFFMRSSENDFFRSPGPLGTGVSGALRPENPEKILKCLLRVWKKSGRSVAKVWTFGTFSRPFPDSPLRGPAAILFISRDTRSDSIAKLFRACFYGVSRSYRAICCKMGYRTNVPV